VKITLPLKTVSEANRREHWALKAKRVKMQRDMASLMVRMAWKGMSLPLTITLTRVSSRQLDSDNLASAMKAVRDGIADAIGVNDGDSRLEWRYKQERAGAGEYGVLVEIERR